MSQPDADVVWRPDDDALHNSQVGRFRRWLATTRALEFVDYHALHRWSVDRPDDFWAAVWEFFRPEVELGAEQLLADRSMPGARWCPGVRINFAAELLRSMPGEQATALIMVDEEGLVAELTRAELRRRVAGLAETLRQNEIGPGDTVAAYLPNRVETVIGLLATATVGASWTSCSPDFGVEAVLSRFAQAEPTVLIATDGYRYNGRWFDRSAQRRQLVKALPTLRLLIMTEASSDVPGPPAVPLLDWPTAISPDVELSFTDVAFDHPLWVLWSSGTTGRPKGIVHSHGGMVLGLLASIGLGSDVRADDRYLVITSAAWMMWNYLIGGLALGATVILYDGSPSASEGAVWRVAEQSRATVLGIGAGYLDAEFRAGARPGEHHDLSRIRTILQTGSTLPTPAWRWVSEAVTPSCWFASMSGGTDLCGVLVGATPLLPVHAGRMAAPYLGVDLHSFDEAGAARIGVEGELVVTSPLPSMPIALLGDHDGTRLRDTYFQPFPGVWRHGDWATVYDDGSVSISGRSDATLNRHGIRMGSAELYAVVEGVAGVADSLVIGLDRPNGGYFLPLFVVTDPGVELDQELTGAITSALRTQLSPRHVPDTIIEIPAVPRTLTGKKLEVPVKRILSGVDPAAVSGGAGAISHPEMLDWFARYARSEPRLRNG